jgi:ApeA N-terminal domain 1
MGLIRRCVGQWWLPDDEDRKVGGVLEIDNVTGLRLEVTDQLLAFGPSFEPMPVVYGAADGRQITLLDINPPNNSPSTVTVTAQLQTTYQVARPLVAMVGIHLADTADAAFNGLTVEMTGLAAFAGRTGLQSTFTGRPDTNERHRYTVNWTDPIETQITEPFEATLGLHWHLKTEMNPKLSAERRRLLATETVVARVESETPQPWSALLDPIRAVQDLVTVATQSPSLVMSRTLHIKPQPVHGAIDIPYTIDLYFRGPSDVADEPQAFDDLRVIFTLETIDFDFSTLIERWFRLRKDIGLAVDALLGLDYQPIGYYEVRLFNAASAGEGFHAGLFPNSTAVDPADHNALKRKVSRFAKGLGRQARRVVEDALADIQTGLREKVLGILEGVASVPQRQWVMGQLGENRKGLNERYEELARRPDSEAVNELLTNVDRWAGWLRDARNAIGHVNTGRLQEKIPEKPRYRLQDITRALLHLVIISELGISTEVQRRVVGDQNIWGFSAARFRKAVNDAAQPAP